LAGTARDRELRVSARSNDAQQLLQEAGPGIATDELEKGASGPRLAG